MIPTDPGATNVPRIVRYVSAHPNHQGKICFGLVFEDNDGIPTGVMNLNEIRPGLGSRFVEFNSAGGFELAEKFASGEERAGSDALEYLDQNHLSEIILPPVDITAEELATGQKVSAAMGLNFGEHKKEAGGGASFVFPKHVVPTGAYTEVKKGPNVVRPGEAVELLDYEVELGFVVLEDIDLSRPPRQQSELLDKLAFFVANDVSDREPIILDSERGYTRGKSLPTYLPIGPWVVHGKHLNPKTSKGGAYPLQMITTVREAQPYEGYALNIRQNDATTSMILGPLAIIYKIATDYDEARMLDREGIARGVASSTSRGPILPAGSIVLTGTPGGTAMRAPSKRDEILLFVSGWFSKKRAVGGFLRHCLTNRKEMGYLSEGDVVESSIQQLGRQRWTVVRE